MVFVTRELHISIRGNAYPLPVRIFTPEVIDDIWTCRYEIDWPERRISHAGYGIDGVQALVGAMQNIANELYSSSYHHDGSLVFDKPGNGYGFPITKNGRAFLVGDDAKFDGN